MATLEARIRALATAVGNHLRDAILPRLLPAGGSSGNVLAKSSVGDWDVGWTAPAGGTPGGSSGQMQFNNAGVFGAMAGTAWDDVNRSLAISGATVTTSKPVLDLSQTWNASGVAFSGLRFNAIDTASAVGSALLNLQLGTRSVQIGRKSTGGYFSIYLNDGVAGNLALEVAANSFRIGLGGDANHNVVVPGAVFLRGASPGIFVGGSVANSPGLYGSPQETNHSLGIRNGDNAQTVNVYGKYVSATDYHRLAIKTVKGVASAVSGATVTLAGLIPDGALVVGVTTKVTTALGTGNGTTGYQVGDGVDPDRWGAITGTAAGTSSDGTNATSGAVNLFTAANDVVLTATGGNFNGTGVIDVCAHYLIAQAD
jgi:hypothetical protein